MARLEKNDILFAHIALHVVPGLSGASRRVGSAILGHLNKKTGQCDPSVDRLARMLGIGRATVLRATSELCGSGGLFERIAHGGRANRTAYLPRWDRLNQIVDDWNLRMKDGSPPPKVSELRLSTSQNCDLYGVEKVSKLRPRRYQNWDLDSLNIETQTLRRNLRKEPKAAVSLSGQVESKSTQADQPRQSKGLGKNGCAGGQVPLLLPVACRRGTAKKDAAEAAEQRRIADRILQLPEHEREAAWLAAMEAKR